MVLTSCHGAIAPVVAVVWLLLGGRDWIFIFLHPHAKLFSHVLQGIASWVDDDQTSTLARARRKAKGFGRGP